MKIVVERPGIAFGAVKEISDYFADVMVDNQRNKDYVYQYISKFQRQFGKYGLKTYRAEDIILANNYLVLGGQKLNIVHSGTKIDQLVIKQKIVS